MSSWLDFIARMTSALAWPGVVVAILLVLRRPISKLLTDGRLSKLKLLSFEAEWDRARDATEGEIEVAKLVAAGDLESEPEPEAEFEAAEPEPEPEHAEPEPEPEPEPEAEAAEPEAKGERESERTSSPEPVAIALGDLTSKAPGATITAAHGIVERELRSIVSSVEPAKNIIFLTANRLARLAEAHELISPASVRAVEGIGVLRNLAAHSGGQDITPKRAAEYLTLVDGVLYAIREEYRRARGTS